MLDTPSLKQLSLSIPLIKVDQEKQIIIGRAALETPDKGNEIMDYASAKPAFQAWSNEIAQLSKGLSKGNLREMHQKTHTIGKVLDVQFDDDNKAIDVMAKISDAAAWKKVLDGEYTGFSVGGGYFSKWNDPTMPGFKRYTPRVTELSIVDNPCIPGCGFAELVKMDGSIEQLELHGRAPRSFAEIWAARPKSFAEIHAARPRSFAEIWASRA